MFRTHGLIHRTSKVQADRIQKRRVLSRPDLEASLDSLLYFLTMTIKYFPKTIEIFDCFSFFDNVEILLITLENP